MQFLALVNRARRECGVAGADLPTLQSGLSYEGTRFVDWVNQAWLDLQMTRADWQWMRGEVSFQTVVGQGDYTLAEMGTTDLGEWLTGSFRSYLTATGTPGEQYMEWVDYTRYRDVYQFSTMRTSQGFPLWLTTKPDHSIAVWQLPNAVYTVRGEYCRAPSELSADADDPVDGGLPERFNMLIVYKAMQSYAAYEAAPEVDERGARLERRDMAKLEAWGLPGMEMAGPLA